jgi:DNA-binding NarL/FixJ family response regulator
MKKPKILLADDHALFREGVKQLLARLHPHVLVIEAANGAEVLHAARAQQDFDLVLLDLAMPGVDGFTGLAAFRTHAPSTPVVVLSASEDAADVRAALDGGASGFISKSSSSEVILGALRLVLAGGVYVPPTLLGGHNAVAAKADIDALTPRQRDVLALLAQGLSNKTIGGTLGLSEATVKQHVSAILKTLNVANRMQAVIAGRRLSPPAKDAG